MDDRAVSAPGEPRDDTQEEAEFSGPDPHTWPDHPVIWNLVLDIEVLGRVQQALAGSNGHSAGPGYDEARRFLAQVGHQLRGELSLMMLGIYGVKPSPEGSDGSPFSTAGRPRAFGAEQPPPQATP